MRFNPRSRLDQANLTIGLRTYVGSRRLEKAHDEAHVCRLWDRHIAPQEPFIISRIWCSRIRHQLLWTSGYRFRPWKRGSFDDDMPMKTAALTMSRCKQVQRFSSRRMKYKFEAGILEKAQTWTRKCLSEPMPGLDCKPETIARVLLLNRLYLISHNVLKVHITTCWITEVTWRLAGLIFRDFDPNYMEGASHHPGYALTGCENTNRIPQIDMLCSYMSVWMVVFVGLHCAAQQLLMQGIRGLNSQKLKINLSKT